MLKISRKEVNPNRLKFKDLKKGDMFTDSKNTDVHIYLRVSIENSCVDLCTGTVYTLDNETPVTKLEGVLTITEEQTERHT